MRINLFLVYPKYRKDIREAVREMTDEYPILKKIIKIIHVKRMNEDFKYCFATSVSLWGRKHLYEIKLNPQAFMNSNINILLHSVSKAHCVSVKSVIYHEIGHCLQLYMLCNKFGIDLKDYKFHDYKKYMVLESEEAEACYREYFEKYFRKYGWNQKKIIYYLGAYAADNPWELLPECFNNYYCLRKKKELNKYELEVCEFTKEIVEDYKKFIPKS